MKTLKSVLPIYVLTIGFLLPCLLVVSSGPIDVHTVFVYFISTMICIGVGMYTYSEYTRLEERQ